MSAPQIASERPDRHNGPGAEYVGPIGQADENVPSSITVLLWTFNIYDEMRLLVIVSLAGTLGTLVHENPVALLVHR
jgi:hypothetical protein